VKIGDVMAKSQQVKPGTFFGDTVQITCL